MSAIPWQKVSLGDYCTKIGSGATPRGGDTVYQEHGIAFIRSQNVYNGRFATSGLAYIEEKHADKLRNVTVEVDDILLNITGDSVARCCCVPDDVLPARVNQHVAIIRTERDKLDPKFLEYFLVSPLMQRTMLSLAGVGGTRKALTKDMIKQFVVPMPQPSVQNRICEVLSVYDDLIDNSRRRIALLEEAARLLYREWFVHFRFPGHEHVEITDGLPQGWEHRTLGEVVDVVKDTVKPSEFAEDDVHIGLEHIPRRSFTLADWEPAKDLASGKTRFAENDILFCKIRPYFHKVGFALRSGLASSDAIIWRVKDTEDWPLVVCATSSDHFVAVASKTVREGSKMPRADWKVLQNYSIPRPSDGLIGVFNDAIRPIADQCKTLALQNRALARARDLLLPRLMNGEIAV